MELWMVFADIFGSYYSTFIVLVVTSSLFLGSFSVAWTSPVLTKLSKSEDNPLGRPITPEECDLLGSLLFAGAAIGPLLFIGSVEEFGRKRTILLSSLILPIAFGTLAFTEKIEIYFICRVLTGFYYGVACSMQPVYVSEICTSKQRSFLMSFSTMFLIFGGLTSYFLGNILPLFYFNGFIGILSIVFISTVALCCPESPYHVMRMEGKDKTKDLLKKIRQTSDVDEEWLEIIETIENEVRTSYLDIFRYMGNLKSFVLATVLLLLQHLSGMIVLVTYVQQIFKETSVPLTPYQSSIVMACLQLITSFFTPVLLKCNTFSRKSLLLFTFLGLAICNFTIGCYFYYGKNSLNLNWLPLFLIFAFVIVYNCGLDPIPWMLVGEIYPMSIKSIGSALSTSLFFLSTFPLLYSFNKIPLHYLFVTCSCFNICGFFFVKYFIIDTDGKSLREIHKSFSHATA